MSLAGKSILSYKQFDKNTLDELFDVASYLKRAVDTKGETNDLAGKYIATAFFEPSTRTTTSFQTAMLRLGGKVLSCESLITHFPVNSH